jgi:endonuclease/exonuclease/phosphatase (EEP) superfamily protein YafD
MKIKKVRLRWDRLVEAKLILVFILILLPSFMWYLMKQVHSPWWLENITATPFSILPIYLLLMLACIRFLSVQQSVIYFTVNFFLAIMFNNTVTFRNQNCTDAVNIFQFNIKYQEDVKLLVPLLQHLIDEKYHLVALQGVSQKSKKQLVKMLSPYFPHYISGGSEVKGVITDQLLFSHYAFSDISYIKEGQHAFLMTSKWQLPFNEIDLYTLHPPSPRNEKLWKIRNKTLYQLKYKLTNPAINKSLVIGDINLSKHSKRMNVLKGSMNSYSVNSWPQKNYIPRFLGLAIDQLWVSRPINICARQRIKQFTWSDHYAIKTQVDFTSLVDFEK